MIEEELILNNNGNVISRKTFYDNGRLKNVSKYDDEGYITYGMAYDKKGNTIGGFGTGKTNSTRELHFLDKLIKEERLKKISIRAYGKMRKGVKNGI